MKKKFIFLAMMCLLGLFGSLNAQTTTVLVGENSAADVIPAAPSIDAYAMLSQQIYKSSELETAGINAGDVINSIAFMPTTVNKASVNWSVYVVNTDKETFSSKTDYVSISESAVYTGALTLVKDEFVTIGFTTPVTYTGGNLLVCVVDYDNAGPELQNKFAVYATTETDYSLYRYGAAPLSVTNPADGLDGLFGARQAQQAYNRNYVQFVVGGEGGVTPDPDPEPEPEPDPTVPEAPQNLEITGVTAESVTLSWTASQNATSYNVYQNDLYIDNVNTTSYIANDLTAETEYCFIVTAVNSDVESASSNQVCGETESSVAPEGPQTKTIGVGTSTYNRTPIYSSKSSSSSQHIYTKGEIDFVPGVISQIAFKQSSSYTNGGSVKIKVYMQNTTKESFVDANDLVSFSEGEPVFDGDLTILDEQEGWLEIELDAPFPYNGENILLTVVHDSGSTLYAANFYTTSATSRSLTNYDGGSYTKRDFVPQLRFVIEAADELEPATPTNLAATANDDGTITLTWDAAENAMSYNVYSGEEQIGATNGTTYTVDNLEEETEYCFTVKSVRFQNVSDASVEVCATTVEQPVTIEFVLTDSYSDSWDDGKLNVSFDDGVTPSQDMTIEYGYSSATYEFTVGKCTVVSWVYTPGYYPSENSFVIRYKDGAEIYSSGSLTSDGASGDFLTTCDMEQPQNLVADNTELYSGETTTITWDAYEGAVSYNVYVNGVKVNEEAVTETSYELTDLSYITSGNTIAVTAVVGDRESPKSAPVNVKVAGTFNLVLNVMDNERNPIAEAMVTITGYDEFDDQNQKNFEFTTDENGMVEETLPLPYKEYSFSIEVSKAPYEKGYLMVWNDSWNGYVENGSTVTHEVTLQLTGVNQIDTDKEYYVAGEDIILYWDAVEGATGYNVYEKYYDAEYNEVFTKLNGETLLTSTLYIIEDGLQYRENGNTICVTAVYTIGESDKGYGTQVKVNGYGTVSGTVTDGTNPIKGASIVITGQDEYYQERTFTFTTAENGTFEGSVVFGDRYEYNKYTATVSKYGYEEVTIENVVVTSASNAYDFGTITLSEVEAQEATINNLVATINNDMVDVRWEAEYARYNVYRKDAAENYEQLGATTANTYTDESWATLENGEYTYGVSAFVEGGVGEVINESFEDGMPEGWNTENGNWTIYSWGGNSDSYSMYSSYGSSGNEYYAVLPPLNPANSSLSFYYQNQEYAWGNPILYDELYVYWSTSSTGPWENQLFYSQSSSSWTYSGDINLSTIEEDIIYIAFCNKTHNANGIYIDDIVITGPVATESSIVWASNALTKNDANVFTGADEWTSAANWSNGVPAEGANVFIKGNVTIASNVNVNNMTINGGSVTINNGASLTVNGTLVNEAAANLVINDGAQIFQNNEDVPATFVMGIANPEEWQSDNKDGWQFISSPFTNASVFNFTNGNYDLFKYDGDEDLEWQNHKANAASFGSTFEQGVGYLASHETESTIELTGTLNAENSYSWNYLYYNEEKPLANFHLLGNPFTFNMDITKAIFTNLVEGVAVVTSDGGYDYSQTTIPVGDAFFVKANGDYYYSSLSYGGRGARSAQSNSLNITATGNAGKDNVVINFAGKSEGFDKLQNFNDAIATVYVAEDGKNYGIYNCDADVQEVELNFNANKMGNYTISIEPNGKFQTVTLVDHFTGVETNMLEGEYTFTAMSGDNHNRFVVRFANGQESTDDSHFVYQSGEELILNIQGDVQIVDVLGRVVYSGEAMNDINRINVSSFNSGAYMVRVMNGNDVKVEKVVIY